ncbi:MAG: site-specific integrase [Streptosporangiaceae bacterium]
MVNVSGVWCTGPLEPYLRGFADELSRSGYTPGSAQHQLRLMAHLSRWLAAEGVEATQVTLPVVEAFVAARRQAGYTVYRSMRGLGPLLGYLRARGVYGGVAAAKPTPAEGLLARYCDYLIRERGLGTSSARRYVNAVRAFVTGRACGDELHLDRLSATDVTAFVLDVCGEHRPGKAKTTVTALRSLLRFLHLEGTFSGSLDAAVPSVASCGWPGCRAGLSPAR